MGRYTELSEEFIDFNGDKRYTSTYYPFIPYRDSDIYLISKRSDRLDLLAHTYYGNHRLWWVIARANDLGKGSLNVPPGIRMRIPYPVNSLIIDEAKQLEDYGRS